MTDKQCILLVNRGDLKPSLGEGNRMEWKGMFESFNRGEWTFHSLICDFKWVGMEWIGGKLIHFYSLKISNFHSTKI